MARRVVPLLVAVLLGTAGQARAQLPPLPVPVPPPQLPQLPVPVPPVNILPPAPPPSPPPAQPQPAPPAVVPDVSGAVGTVTQTVTGGLGLGATSGATGSTASGTGSAPARPRTRRVRAPKPGVRNTGAPKRRRAAVVSFSLAKPAQVRFRIQREAPDCTFVGMFTVRGHAGVNRVRFAGRFRGEPLPPGTYALTANAFRGGRYVSLGRTRVVVVPAGKSVDSARPQRSTCRAGGSGTASATTDSSPSAAGAGGATGDEAEGREDENLAPGGGAGGDGDGDGDGKESGSGEAAGSGTAGEAVAGSAVGSPRDGRMLGVPNPFENAPAWLQPLLLAALAFAILALLAAALPVAAVRPVGVAPTVERRRTELALAGAFILGVVAIAALVL